MQQQYTITAVGDDWIEIWDGDSIVDPDLPRHKSTDQVFVGAPHQFQVDDIVVLQVRLVCRITPPAEVPTRAEQITEAFKDVPTYDREGWDAFQRRMYEGDRDDREVFDQHA